MPERGEPRKRKREDAIVRPAARVRDEPDAAGIVLEPLVIEREGASVGRVAASLAHGLGSGEGGRPAAVDEESTATGQRIRTSGGG
jgi:hypothetical protein